MLDAFNVLNSNVIIEYGSDNLSESDVTAPDSIIAPRVFRIGATFNF